MYIHLCNTSTYTSICTSIYTYTYLIRIHIHTIRIHHTYIICIHIPIPHTYSIRVYIYHTHTHIIHHTIHTKYTSNTPIFCPDFPENRPKNPPTIHQEFTQTNPWNFKISNQNSHEFNIII